MNFTKLRYRFPGELVNYKIGRFEVVADPNVFEGFVVSDFKGEQFYGFIEDITIEEKYVIQQPPTQIDYSTYIHNAERLIQQFYIRKVEKTVFSRVEKVNMSEYEFEKLFDILIERYPYAFCYWFDSPSLGRWMAASPELLVDIENEKGKTVALAGTRPNKENTKWTEKEVYEQQLVTEFIEKKLQQYASFVYTHERKEFEAGPVKHLINHIDFSIPVDKQWSLISQLHPTPAVSGTPRKRSMELISEFETHDRSLYGGIIGENCRQRKRMYVNLRSAQFINDSLYVYVGGGLTKDSTPEHEWEETVRKSRTFLDLLPTKQSVS